MADPIKDTDVPAAADAPADAPAADPSSAETPAADKEGEGSGEGEGDGGEPAAADPEPKADEGVATRRHNQQNAATRIATKNAAPAPTDTAGGDEGAETDLSKVQSELAEIRSREEAREDEAEMDQIIGENADLAKYKDQVKKLAADPSRKQVPIKSLFYEAAGDDLIKIGANRASEANADAAETQQNGTSTGNSPDGASVSDMSNEDFSKMQEDVRLKQ